MSLLAAVAACASGGGGPVPLDFTTVRPAGQMEGAWVGGTDALGGYILIEADFRRVDGRLEGELRAPSENVSRLPVTAVEVSDSMVRFSFHSPFGEHHATASWTDGMLFGRVEGNGLSGNLHLLPVLSADPAVSRARAGSWSERAGHRLLVTVRSSGGMGWAETETLDDGAVWIAGGALYGYSADTVFTDRSIRADPRLHEWAAFRGDDEIEWHPEAGPVRITRRADDAIVQEAVTFTSGDVTLSGTLLLPPGAGPHPAAVMVHGSGPAERTNLLTLLRADLFLRSGIAVLLYDKRGVAGSSGDWEQAGIHDLAGDAAAGVALLRAHPTIADRAVGLIGHSQAGWVIPAAAAMARGADFLVVLSGGGVSPREQEVFRARAEAAAAGLSAEDAAALMEAKWRYAGTGDDWAAYIGRVAAADPAVVALVEAVPTQDPARWSLVRALARYDPLADLRAIHVPALVVFGADDDNVPVSVAAGIWRDAVSPALLTVETVPGVGHALVGLRDGRGSIFPEPLVRTLATWLEARPWASDR